MPTGSYPANELNLFGDPGAVTPEQAICGKVARTFAMPVAETTQDANGFFPCLAEKAIALGGCNWHKRGRHFRPFTESATRTKSQQSQ